MRNSVLALMMVALSSASGSVVGYHIEPVKAAWSGWTPQFGNVSQSVVACWDSLERVELFAGTRGNSGYYHVAVYDSGTLVMWSDGEQDWDSRWVRFENWDRRAAFTKGKQYKFQFSRGPYGGIQYYYSEDPYKYGQLIVGQQEYPDRDLAMRAYGRMNVPDRSFWGGFAALPFWNGVNEPNRRDTWRVYMNETGWGSATFVCDWSINQPSTPDSWDFYDTDAHIREICNTGARPIGILLFSPPWITSREDSTSGGGYGPVPYAAPRNLWPGESETNYYARWVDTLLGHLDQANPSLGSPADSVHTWVIWNEPNDTLNYGTPSTTGWWRRPNLTYTDGFDGLRGLCLLYMRMCYVVNQRLRSDTKHQYDRLLIGAMHRDVLRSDSNLVSGVDWLDMCYQVAEDSGWGIFWDGVAEHAYQEESFVLSPTKLEFSAETLRAVMHEHEDYSSELWNTECGWNCRPRGMTREEDANNVCAAFAASLALQALPSAGGGYDGLCWWLPYYPGTGSWNWMWLWDDTLDEVSLDPQYGYYSFKQTRSTLAGKRFNGRVMTGDSAGDTKVRMYEFEDPASLKKTWVCWSTLGAQDGGLVAGLPARSDTAETTALDYGDNPQPSDKPAAATGWLWPVLTSRPVFITEPDERAISRPDLVLDSIMVPVGAQVRSVMDVHAFVKNLGNDTTPDTVALDFLCDTTVFAHGTSGWPIAPGDSYDISFEINPIPEWMGGWHLFWARVNPGQTYVEKVSMDDNCGYVRRCIRCPPNGRVDVVGSPLCKADMPILPLRLESHSWESDSTGETPADSARVLFAWYGQGDSVVHATDTTAWFPFCTDTVLEYPRGCGVYSVQAQFRDSGANDSPFYGDSTDSIVVFDSVPPAGSIIIEDGGEFASNSIRTLRLAASDSASGVCEMRFMNRSRVDLVDNGAFAAGGASWSFEQGEVDDSLRIARLTVGPTPATATQFAPIEAISAYAGDSCVLEASVLAHVHDDDATGSLSFWYYATRPDTWPVPETLYQLADSAGFSGSLLSLSGRSCLSKRFLLAPPDPGPDWVSRGGMVKVEASAENGLGIIWVDNVAINAFEPESAYAWWGPYDTVTQWDIGSGAGTKVVGALFLDSAGTENAVAYADTVILDPTPPIVDISLPMLGQLVNGLVDVIGVAYDTIEVPGDSWFHHRTLTYRHSDSTNWLPVDPDSVSYQPAWPDSMASQGPAVHLGYWNTTGLEDGAYYLLLTAADSAENVSSCTTWVMVDQGFGGGGMRSGPEGGATGMGEGSCYIGSADGHVLHVSDDLAVLDTFSVCDSGSQAYVTALLEVSEDSLLVLDAANRRVHKLHRSGQHRRRLVSGLSQPADLKRDTNGNFWLVDRGWNRIGKFRSNGALVFVRGGFGADSLHFRSPEGIAVKGGLVYVADAGNNRLCVWDTSGHFRTTITGDFENPTSVFVTDNGAIYLTDGNDGKLKGITPLGGNIVSIGTADSARLKGLVPSENRHSLFSLASEPNKVYKLRIQSDESQPGGQQSAGKVNLPKTLSLNQPFPNPARTRLHIAYALPRQTRVALKVYDVTGKLVKALVNGEQKPGYYSLVWNRQDTKGRSCACGVYFCTLAAENQRFSRKVILTE